MEKLFKAISWLRYIFSAWGLIVALPELYYRSPNTISNIGLGVFLIGIGISLGGLVDDGQLTAKDMKFFSKKRLSKFGIAYGFFWVCVTILLGVFFLLVEYFYPSIPTNLRDQVHDVGLGTMALAVGMMTEQKKVYDKLKKYQALEKELKEDTIEKN